MSSLKHRIQFYRILATLEEAGMPRVRALRQHFPGLFASLSARIADTVESGGSISEGMGNCGRRFTVFERSLVSVGERSGRLDVVYRSLADWFQLLQSLRGRLISGLMYPALVYHFAGVLIPFISIFTDNLSPALAASRALIWLSLPWLFYVAAGVGSALFSGVPVFDGVFLHIPLLGGAIYTLNCARFFHALSLCLEAGLGMVNAVDLAAGGCTNAVLRGRFQRLSRAMRNTGCSFTEAFSENMTHRDRNSLIPELMHTGELSGRSDDAARRIARTCQEDLETLLTRVAAVLPTILYLALVLYIAVKIVSFYGRILGSVRELL